MQLADDVELGAEVQPVKLSANCPPLRLNESVVFAGTGDFTIEDSAFNDIPILRQAYAKISPCDHWEKLIEQEVDQTTLICTDVIDDRGAYSGDSGTFFQCTLSFYGFENFTIDIFLWIFLFLRVFRRTFASTRRRFIDWRYELCECQKW